MGQGGEAPHLRLGAVTEVVSELGDGGTSWALRALSAFLADHPERYGLYVDVEGTFYPPAAVAAGVPLDRILLVRASELLVGLRAVELGLRGGVVRVAVVSVPSGTAPIRPALYHRLRQRVRDASGALVVVSSQTFVPADVRVCLG